MESGDPFLPVKWLCFKAKVGYNKDEKEVEEIEVCRNNPRWLQRARAVNLWFFFGIGSALMGLFNRRAALRTELVLTNKCFLPALGVKRAERY